MSKTWINCHSHDIFSLLDGYGKQATYAERAVELGMPALATTNHGNLFGIYKHYKTCKEFGIKPILGIELYQARKTREDRDDEERSGPSTSEWGQRGPHHLTVLASNNAGYKNLIKLSSRAYLEGYFGKPRADMQLIEDHADGLIILSGCLSGQVQQALLRGDYQGALLHAATMQEIVGRENYFIEVMDHGIPEEQAVMPDLLRIAKQIDARIAPTNDTHYVNRDDHDHHDTMLCQPAGTQVLMQDGTQKNIEDVIVGDKVISWDGSDRRGKILKSGQSVIEVSTRPHRERLVKIATPSGASSSYTADHICIARADTELADGNFCVYMMRRGDKYRIGVTKHRREGRRGAMPGVALRAKEQGADAIWILSAHKTLSDALLNEQLVSYKWNIPTLQFQPTVDPRRNTQTPIPVGEFWNAIDSNHDRAIWCLKKYGRHPSYPFWEAGQSTSMRRPLEIRACNLMDGMLVCEPGQMNKPGLTNEGSGAWQPITIERVFGPSNEVFSIEVENDHTYIADGIVTHNCIGTRALKATEERFKFCGPEFYLKSREEMERLFEGEWLDNTLAIAEMCDVEIDMDTLYFPSFPDVPKDKTPDEFFVEEAWRGMHERFGETIPEDYKTRADYELGVIREMGFQEYFLVTSDLIRAAKDNGVHIGWGRGSAAASIIAYAMQITNLDPIKFGLLFERFLIPGRVSMPDIDIDTDDREWMINYTKEKYGRERVAQIATFAEVKPKSAIRDAARVLGYESSVADKIAKMVPPAVLGKDKTMDEVMANPDIAKFYREDKDARIILDEAKGLVGLIRQPGIHAAGVVIAPSDITDYVPVMISKESGDTVTTQCDMYEVEDMGLLKMDYLGLRNLWVMAKTIELVNERHGLNIEQDEIPLDDHKTYRMLQSGQSVGVFQVEGGGMQEMMMDMRPDNINDIMALIALYRPGPMGSGMHKMYIERKRGRAKVEAPHPLLQDDLANSLGIMLYQEDVLRVITKLAGWSVAEADDLRRVIGKKYMDKVASYREKFVEGCIKTNNVPKHLADKIFSDIEYFAGYGFNLAHSASYMMVTYITAYLKANFPVEYMAKLLTSVVDKPDKLSFYLRECQHMGIEVLPPSIVKSEDEFTVESDKQIRFGLIAIRGIGESIVNNFVAQRMYYNNTYEFFRTVDTALLNSGTIASLVKSGALDELIPEPEGQMTASEKREFLFDERHSLGVYVTQHPLDDVIHALAPMCDSAVEDLYKQPENGIVKIGGIITQVQKKTTKRGGNMYILELEDLTGAIEVVLFPKLFEQWEGKFAVGDIVIMEGRLGRDTKEDEESGHTELIHKLYFNNMVTPVLPENSEPPIILPLYAKPTYDMLVTMDGLLDKNPGNSEVYIEFPEDDKTVTVKFRKTADYGIREDLNTLGFTYVD